MATNFIPTPDLARKLIAEQFPEYVGLHITDVEKQGLDNTNQKQNAIISKFSISELSNEFAWITLPIFDLKTEQEKYLGEFVKQLLDLQTKKYIVFDLRGNQVWNSDQSLPQRSLLR